MAFILDKVIGGVLKHQQKQKEMDRTRNRRFTGPGVDLLNKQRTEGTVDVGKRVGEFAGDVYGQAARVSSNTRGRLYAQGMGGSMAGQRAINEPGIAAAGMVGKERGRLEDLNQASKDRASEAYALAFQNFQDKRRADMDRIDAERDANRVGAIGGIIGDTVNLGVGALTGGAGGGVAGAMGGLLKNALTKNKINNGSDSYGLRPKAGMPSLNGTEIPESLEFGNKILSNLLNTPEEASWDDLVKLSPSARKTYFMRKFGYTPAEADAENFSFEYGGKK